MKRLLATAVLLMFATASWAAFGTPVVDGTIDAVYGAPLGMDPSGDGNFNTNMDLGDVYVCNDLNYFYVAFTVNANITTINWGKYIVYLDVAGGGSFTDPWGRNVTSGPGHQPELSFPCWVDQPFDVNAGNPQAWLYSGGWSQLPTNIFISSAARSGAAVSVIEYQISSAAIGNPSSMCLTIWSTGGGGGDNAQDQIPAGWDASDWGTQAVLNNYSCYTTAVMPVMLSSFSARNVNQNVVLNWTMESEVENAGFRILRSTERDGEYRLVSGVIPGAGNSSTPTHYSFTDASVVAGMTYYYKLMDISLQGDETTHPNIATVTVANPSNAVVPNTVRLAQNYPNPFNPETSIAFDLTVGQNVKVTITDLTGRELRTVTNRSFAAGHHAVTVNLSELPSGMYLYRIETESGFSTVKKMTLMK